MVGLRSSIIPTLIGTTALSMKLDSISSSEELASSEGVVVLASGYFEKECPWSAMEVVEMGANRVVTDGRWWESDGGMLRGLAPNPSQVADVCSLIFCLWGQSRELGMGVGPNSY